MTDVGFAQHALAEKRPDNYPGVKGLAGDYTPLEGVIKYNLDSGSLGFYIEINTPFAIKEDDLYDKLNFAIDKNYLVTLILDVSLDWQWSLKYDAVTMKSKNKNYGELRYLDGAVWKTKSQIKPGSQITKVRFAARMSNDSSNSRHSFSLNIDLMQKNSVPEQRKLRLPITIDPDIINPRPPSQEGDITISNHKISLFCTE